MTDNISTDIRRIVRNSILKTFLLTLIVSTIGLFIFFNQEANGFEGGQALTLFSIFNFITIILLTIISLSALSIANINAHKSKFSILASYFGPIVFLFLITLLLVKSSDKISYVPLFASTTYLIFWATFYKTLHKRITQKEN